MTNYSGLIEKEYCYNCKEYVTVETDVIDGRYRITYTVRCADCGTVIRIFSEEKQL